jgi:hypothetical protein
MSPYPEDWDDDYDDSTDCANCGGDGYVSHCFQEFACMHPDEGCEDCMRRCDWCNPPKPRLPTNDVEALRKVLSAALREAGEQQRERV